MFGGFRIAKKNELCILLPSLVPICPVLSMKEITMHMTMTDANSDNTLQDTFY